MTAFSFEVPHAHLADFEDLQDFHFILSMHLTNEKYLSYYQEQSLKGAKQVWLDNSFNEMGKADEVYSLVNSLRKVDAHKLIVPDDPTWTKEELLARYRIAREYLEPSQLIVVVSSSEMRAYMLEKGVKKLAVSYHVRLPHYRAGGLYHDFAWAKNCHFLGMTTVAELKQLKPVSCDTSMPVKIALLGQTLQQWIERGCTHIHTRDNLNFFDLILNDKQLELARNNIIALKEMVNGS